MKPLSVLLLSLAPSVASADWQTIGPELTLAYPEDHGAHPAYQTEWWYLTGNVSDASGRRFGIQFTIFRRGLDPEPPRAGAPPLRANHVLLGHMAVTDVQSERTLFAERMRREAPPLARASRADLDLVLDDWSLVRTPDDALVVRAGDTAAALEMELRFEPTKARVLHGGSGYSRKGSDPRNASAYMSWTRLATSGRLKVDGETFQVSGASWYDHEFGSSVLEEGTQGWDWFGLQLDGGRELMAFVLRGEDGPRMAAGTWIEADGTTRALRGADVRLVSSATWTSPTTEAVYPARWTLTLPTLDEELEIVPLVANAELVTGGSTGISYWEGPVAVSGTSDGVGYAELTGYAGDMGTRF